MRGGELVGKEVLLDHYRGRKHQVRDVRAELQQHLKRLCRAVALTAAAACAVFWIATFPASAAELEIEPVLPEGAAPGRVQLQLLEAVSVAGSAPPKPIVHDLEVPGSLRVELAEGSVWHVALVSDDLWMAPEVIAVAERDRVQLPLWFTARVRGEVAVGPSETAPDEVTLRFESPPDSTESIARSTALCPVADGQFECVLPATRLDLRLRAPGFISHYFWDVALEPRGKRDVGRVTLERGASVVGWIEMADPEASFDDIQVALSREIASVGLSEDDTARRKAMKLASAVNDRGFYEFAGVSEGLYAVTAFHPDFAPARYSPIQVFENAETELPAIEMLEGVALRVVLEPARTHLGRRWQVQLLRRGEAPGHLEEAAAGAADGEGVWLEKGLPPGDYFLRVHEGPGSTWYSADVSLAAGADEVRHDVALPVEVLEGSVFLGSEPVAANLYFGGYHGAQRIPAESDGEGRFEVRVPERESWTVDVYTKVEDARQRFQEVVPDAPGTDGKRWLELVIPDTLVEGRVVDVDGRPVEGAGVRLSGPVGGATYRSKSDGRFELRGLRPGRYWLRARTVDPQRQSEIHRFVLEEDEVPEPFELVVRALRWVEGQVVGPSGQPVVGAKVVALVEQTAESPIAARVPEAVTDLDGAFSLALPELASGVQLTVFPPGFAVSQLRVDAARADPVLIRVEPLGGTLRIHHGDQLGLEDVKVFQSFLLPSYHILINWAELNGESSVADGILTVPMAGPGYYAACRDLGFEVRMTGVRQAGPDPRCAEGVLAPYGELQLRIPERE